MKLRDEIQQKTENSVYSENNINDEWKEGEVETHK